MAIGTATPRDQLDRIIAFVRRAMRYWWVVALVGMFGGVMGVMLALKAKPKYVSEAKLLYNEKIQSSFLGDRNMVQRTKNLGNKYREILLARPQLGEVITELGLLPKVVEADGLDVAIDELKPLIKFRVRGTSMFRIQYTSNDPDEAQAVTAMLTDMLMAKERSLSQEKALSTKKFLLDEKTKANTELATRQRALYEFLAQNPEFAENTGAGDKAATGAGIRAAAQGKSPEAIQSLRNVDPRLAALERQRRRIKKSLEAPEPSRRRPQKTTEQRDAERAVKDAKTELRRAERNLEEKLEKYQPAHPDVRSAERKVRDAKERVGRAEAAVPPDPPTPPNKVDREKLARELKEIEGQISSTRARLRRKKSGDGDRAEEVVKDEDQEPASLVVQLENEFASLDQAVREARRRVSGLDSSLSKAEIKASQQMAEEGAVLSLIEPPNKPTIPQGKGKIFLLAVVTMVFLVMGSVLALALALVDDRIYTAGDLEHLGVAPVMVVIPKGPRRKWFRRG